MNPESFYPDAISTTNRILPDHRNRAARRSRRPIPSAPRYWGAGPAGPPSPSSRRALRKRERQNRQAGRR